MMSISSASNFKLQNSSTTSIEIAPAGAQNDNNHSPVSQASTVKFDYCDHVPFKEFEPQVRGLCNALWPATTQEVVDRPFKPLKQRIREGLAGALGIKEPLSPQALAQTLPQNRKEYIIEHLRGGNFNRVIGITVIEDGKRESRMVLRVPRGNLAQPEHDVTLLRFAEKYAMVPVPEVIAHDFTRDNFLGAPYVLQKRIDGLDLESKTRSYPNLTHQQKKDFVDDFTQVITNLQSVENPYAGRIDIDLDEKGEKHFTVGPLFFGPEEDDVIARRSAEIPFFKIRKFEAIGPDDTASDDALLEIASDFSGRPEHQTPYFFLMTQLGRRKAFTLESHPHLFGKRSLVDELGIVATQMNEMGYLDTFGGEDVPFCLTHYDLDPRNIMVDVNERGRLNLTGVLDWDLAMFAPK